MESEEPIDQNTENFLQTVEKIVDINHIKKIQLEQIELIKKIIFLCKSYIINI